MRRDHFAIDREDTGYVLVDQASTCGTIAEGKSVGGQPPGGIEEAGFYLRVKLPPHTA